MSGSSILFLLLAILLIGVLIFIFFIMTQKRGHIFDVQKYQSEWLKIEESLNPNNPATCTLAVVDADKLLDHALRELGTPGNTLGERLKASRTKFTQINAVWHAHKLRNQIAHERGFRVTYPQAKRALAAFRQALKDLGAI